MAWQTSGVLVGNGGAPGTNGDGVHGSQSQGTEYTLQGVMRFLQTEWHRHERDRNAWEIERAEMKSRIGKLEGDGRTSKRLQETLGKHVKILENALKREREKVKALQLSQTSSSETKAEDVGKAPEEPKPVLKPALTKPHNSFFDTEGEEHGSPDLKQDIEREKSRVYLRKCIEEVTYHVVPTTAAQQQLADEQEQMLQQSHDYQNQLSLSDVYVQQRHKQPPSHLSMMNPSSLPNHEPPPIPRASEPLLARPAQSSGHAAYMSRGLPEAQMISQAGPLTSIDTRNAARTSYDFPAAGEEQVEKVSHSYNSYGQQVPTKDDHEGARVSEEPDTADTDGWNFDEPSEPSQEESAPPAYAPPQRPDTDAFPTASNAPLKSPPRGGPLSHRRKSSLSRRRQSDGSHELRDLSLSHGAGGHKGQSSEFMVRFALRGHLDVVRCVIFTGGGSPSEPEICTTGDDGVIKRWVIPASYSGYGPHPTAGNDLDIPSYFTHRGHTGAVMCLAASPASQIFSNGGRALGDGWVFSGGQDATIRVWERGRVDSKATLEGHTDAVWALCVLPGSSASVFGDQSARHGGPERIILASGSADGSILIWSVSAPPQLTSPHTGSRRGAGGSRRANSISSGSNFPSSPQPSMATGTPFHHTLIHRIERPGNPSPTCINPLSMSGDTFVVSFTDASVLIYDTRTAEEVIGMASAESYDGTSATGVNAVVATTIGLDGTLTFDSGRGISEDESIVHGPTGSSSGVEGMVFSGHEDRYIRFFDANSGQGTYSMLAHTSAISSLSLSPDGRELVSAGHDASLRFWSLETRSCTQIITSHRHMRGEGVCAVVWSQDGRFVVSGGGDGVVKVFAR